MFNQLLRFKLNPIIMKVNHYLIAILALSIFSCQKEPMQMDESAASRGSKDQSANNVTDPNSAVSSYFTNQMVIQYETDLTETEKQALRDEYEVIDHKNCTCADPNLELWIFSTLGGVNEASLEEKVLTAKEESDLEGADFNGYIYHDNSADDVSTFQTGINLSKVVPANTNVTIAVLDSGVDYNHFGFDQPFLYNSSLGGNSGGANGMQDYFGWDFVNNDNDPFDDNGHGTIVNSLIYDALNQSNVSFQILEIKSFNEEGKGQYFDVLCGFVYALKNPDVDIINMSFGWNGAGIGFELFDKYIIESQDQVLLTTSAGNSGNNTDNLPHYPSGHESPNILSVAALAGNMESIGLSAFSNYGAETVDIAAKGENIEFFVSPLESITVSGTSFSTAYVTALGAANYSPQINVSQHIEAVLENTIYNSNLNTIQHSSYINN